MSSAKPSAHHRQFALLVLLLLSALDYVYWDAEVKIASLPELVFFVPAPSRGDAVPPAYQPSYLPGR
ncbi:MAG: hypothetical protein JO035_08285 [Betaproteobacteria bacterium]|nr:hypothetical protein [Betaproteobacteria bacterium]